MEWAKREMEKATAEPRAKTRAVESSHKDALIGELARGYLELEGRMRTVEGTIYEKWRIKASHPFGQAMATEGQRLDQAAKGGEKLGSFHLLIWAKAIDVLAMDSSTPEPLKAEIKAYQQIYNTDMVGVGLEVQHFRQKLLSKRRDQQDSDRERMLFITIQGDAGTLWKSIREHIISQGAKLETGRAPKGPRPRSIERLMKTMGIDTSQNHNRFKNSDADMS